MLVRANRAVDIIGQRLLTSFRGSETTQLPDQTFWDVLRTWHKKFFTAQLMEMDSLRF